MIRILDKKAQVQTTNILASIIIALIIWFAGTMVIEMIEGNIDTARIDNECTNPTSDGNKLLCLMFDATIPYFILMILSIAGGMLTSRFLI